MPDFAYVAFSKDGRKTKGKVDAGSLTDARRQLRALGLSVIEIEAASERATVSRGDILGVFSAKLDYARLFSDLAVLLNAGLGIDQATRAVRDASHGRTRVALQALFDQLTSGMSPSAAFARMPAIPQDALALIVSGEKVARLPQVMALIGEELIRRQNQKKELIDALIYPAFLLVMMIFAIGVLSFVLVPSLQPIFESSGRETPIVLWILSSLRDLLIHPAVVLSFFVFVLISLAVTLMRPAQMRSVAGASFLKLPLFGDVMSRIALARYLQNLALLIENSVALPDALKTTADGCAIPSYRGKLHSVRDQVLSGKTVHDAFASIDLMPAGILSLIAIGDEVNRLGPVLAGASNAMQLDAQRTLQRATTLLTPIITIVLGALVGSLVISVMSALLSINELSL
ncbi:type II secretion system F family protein [Rhizobium sp.]|uniref:type II secretion system F family protein n=1 Tax=Rhizobium sp. TaxID=391 RepID=UPI00289C0673